MSSGLDHGPSEITGQLSELGDLWERIHSQGDSTAPHQLAPAIPFDTRALQFLVENSKVLGPADSPAVRDYIEGMSVVEAWEVGISDPPIAAWVMLHGRRRSERPTGEGVYDRPGLIVSMAGYMATAGNCESMCVSILPQVYDPETKEWSADTELTLAAYGNLALDCLPATPVEQMAMYSLSRAVHQLLDPILPLGTRFRPLAIGPDSYWITYN